MGFTLSTGLRNFMLHDGSLKRALQGGEIRIYSGSKPSSADSAPTGTLLVTITDTSGSRTAEVLSTGTVTLTGGASGTVDAITVNSVAILPSAISYNGSLTQTATDVAAAITNNMSVPEYTATAAGAVITISAVPGTGATPNTYVVACTSTTITHSETDMAGGVTSVNGLLFGASSSGTLTKSGTWSGVGVAAGTAGWFRFTGSIADAGGSSTTLIRLDGEVSTTGAVMNLNSTAIAVSATTTIDTVSITLPAS